jgi:hypothetical protein
VAAHRALRRTVLGLRRGAAGGHLRARVARHDEPRCRIVRHQGQGRPRGRSDPAGGGHQQAPPGAGKLRSAAAKHPEDAEDARGPGRDQVRGQPPASRRPAPSRGRVGDRAGHHGPDLRGVGLAGGRAGAAPARAGLRRAATVRGQRLARAAYAADGLARTARDGSHRPPGQRRHVPGDVPRRARGERAAGAADRRAARARRGRTGARPPRAGRPGRGHERGAASARNRLARRSARLRCRARVRANPGRSAAARAARIQPAPERDPAQRSGRVRARARWEPRWPRRAADRQQRPGRARRGGRPPVSALPAPGARSARSRGRLRSRAVDRGRRRRRSRRRARHRPGGGRGAAG